MNNLVKFFADDDGCAIDRPVWHLVDPASNAVAISLCTGEVFGAGESAGVVYEERTAPRGGITCPDCLQKLRIYKAVKL